MPRTLGPLLTTFILLILRDICSWIAHKQYVDKVFPLLCFEGDMVPWDSIGRGLLAFAAWIAALIEVSMPILAGGLSALLGTYAGSILASQRQRTEILREDVCRPMMNELEKIADGKIPSESVWIDIDAVSKQLLDENLRQAIQGYTHTLEDISELDRNISYFEKQIARRFQKSRAVITTDDKSNISIKVGKLEHHQIPYEDQFTEINLSKFVKELPDVGEFYTEGGSAPEQVHHLREWAESDKCRFENLVDVWDSASHNWEKEFQQLFRAPVSRYQDNVYNKAEKEEKLRESASTIFSDLSNILEDRHNFRRRLMSIFF